MQKKKNLIKLLIIFSTILIIIGIIATVYLKTDLLKSKKQIFYKYLFCNQILEILPNKIDDNMKSYSSTGNIELIYDYNNEIFKTLIEKYLNNVEFVYKYSQNIRKMLFLYMPFIDFFDKIRYKYNEQYSISSINELIDDLDKSETTHIHYKCISKKDLGLVLNDLSKIYKDIDFI